MIAFLAGVIAARIAVVLCPVVVALPFLLRRSRLSRGLGPAQEHATPYLQRLSPHFWLGYVILGLSAVHAGAVMPAMFRANAIGIVAATVAFIVLVLEVVLGLTLTDPKASPRRPLRRLHFWTMTLFLAGLGLHLWLNG
jgi:hypothetical protein